MSSVWLAVVEVASDFCMTDLFALTVLIHAPVENVNV